jgi:alpha-L-rhamnosidase
MQKDMPSWGFWLTNGATTAFEGWSTSVRSYCHFFLGTYDEWFYQNLAGIQNPRDGYKTVTIRPEIYKELGFVNASVDTVRGELVSNWKVKDDGSATVTVTVPVGTTADILLPTSDASSVQLNSAALAVQTGIQEIGTQDDRVLVRAISGTYQFELASFK